MIKEQQLLKIENAEKFMTIKALVNYIWFLILNLAVGKIGNGDIESAIKLVVKTNKDMERIQFYPEEKWSKMRPEVDKLDEIFFDKLYSEKHSKTNLKAFHKNCNSELVCKQCNAAVKKGEIKYEIKNQ